MSVNKITPRIKERLRLSLPLRVRCYESADYEWVELSRLLDVTAFGAGFKISFSEYQPQSSQSAQSMKSRSYLYLVLCVLCVLCG
jgi:hypothetical protein